MTTRTIVTLTGRVQGVGFRYTVLRIAARHSVAGTVRNLRSGGVEIDVEGAAAEVAAFLTDVLAHQPPGSRVTGSERRDAEPRRLCTFSEAQTV
jgi:acylphosphatase